MAYELSIFIESLFNYDPNFDELDLFCAYPGLTNFDKILLGYIVPGACALWLVLFELLNWSGCCRLFHARRGGTYLMQYTRLIFEFYFIKAFIKFLLQVYAVITRTTFELLSCRTLGQKQRMYYAANIECWSHLWQFFLLFIVVPICVFGPVFAWFKLYKAKNNKIRTAWWHLATLGYRRRFWWYDSFQMFRRLLIIVVVALPIEELQRLILIRYLCFLYLLIHIALKPFADYKYYHEIGININHLETFCLMLLCILSLMADYDQTNMLFAFSMLKMIPFGIFILIISFKLAPKSWKKCLPEPPLIQKGKNKYFQSPTASLIKSQRRQKSKGGYPSSSSQLFDHINDIDEDDEYEKNLITTTNHKSSRKLLTDLSPAVHIANTNKQISSAWEEEEEESEAGEGEMLYVIPSKTSIDRKRRSATNTLHTPESKRSGRGRNREKQQMEVEISMVSMNNNRQKSNSLTPKSVIERLKRDKSKSTEGDMNYRSLQNDDDDEIQIENDTIYKKPSIFKGKSISTPKYISISDSVGLIDDDDDDQNLRLTPQKSTHL